MGTSIGQALEFMTALAKKVPWGNTDSGLVQRLILEIDRVGPEFVQFLNNGGRCTSLAPKVKAKSYKPAVLEPTIIELDLELDDSLDFDAGKALGEYDDVSPDATAERFPSENSGRGKRMVKAKLVCFHRPLYDEENDSEVDREIGKLSIGKRGGTQAILAVGAQHKEHQRTKYIVGSASWTHPDGSRGFLCLSSGKVGRWLRLHWFRQGSQWSVGAWFVVVPQE